ncbi:MAG: Nif3-like dinuclear metal center hexameric protein [Candidatus Ranarchaeia archaeon]
MVTLYNLINSLDKISPPKNAEPGDNIGIQVGRSDSLFLKSVNAKNVTISLTPTSEAIVRAAKEKSNFLITHLPISFEPRTKLVNEKYSLVKHLISNGITLYSLGSSWEGAEHGINPTLIELLGLETQQLFPSSLDKKSTNVGRVAKPKRQITLQTLVRLIAEKLKINHVSFIGSETSEIDSVVVLGGRSLRIENIREAQKQEINTIITSSTNPYQQYIINQLKMNLIHIPYEAAVTPGIRRLKQIMQLDIPSVKLHYIEVPSRVKSMYFL